jgi:hypothetical protein
MIDLQWLLDLYNAEHFKNQKQSAVKKELKLINQKCVKCNANLERTATLQEETKPGPGDLCFCAYCGAGYKIIHSITRNQLERVLLPDDVTAAFLNENPGIKQLIEMSVDYFKKRN